MVVNYTEMDPNERPHCHRLGRPWLPLSLVLLVLAAPVHLSVPMNSIQLGTLSNPNEGACKFVAELEIYLMDVD